MKKFLIDVIKLIEIVGSYCENDEFYTDPYTGYWAWLYVISKALELFDTLFLVLRKRPLIFLHYYHHSVTFLFTQFVYPKEQAWLRWMATLNLMVHTVMYL